MKYRSSESEEDALSLEQNFTKSSSPEGNLSDQYAYGLTAGIPTSCE